MPANRYSLVSYSRTAWLSLTVYTLIEAATVSAAST